LEIFHLDGLDGKRAIHHLDLNASWTAPGTIGDNSDRWIRFEWPIRAETVPQVCWWRDHRGPGQRLMAL
jgi:hypothetical protein